MLTAEDRAAVPGMRRDRAPSPAERERVELVLVSAAGRSPPGIAAHLGCHPKTVRLVLERFQTDCIASPWRSRPLRRPTRRVGRR